MTKPNKSNLTGLKKNSLIVKFLEKLGSVILVDPYPFPGNGKKKEK